VNKIIRFATCSELNICFAVYSIKKITVNLHKQGTAYAVPCHPFKYKYFSCEWL